MTRVMVALSVPLLLITLGCGNCQTAVPGTIGETLRVCPPVDIVFIMDTSGSMEDEAQALCDAIVGVEQNLRDLGLAQIRTTLLGIVNAPGIEEPDAADSAPDPDTGFDCLTNTVYRVAGGDGTTHPAVPGTMPSEAVFEDPDNPGDFDTVHPSVLDPTDPESEEFWAAATALIAERFPWIPNATGRPPTVRIIVPITDESPQTGQNTCFPIDTLAIDNAASVAVAHDVIVSPVIGSADEFRDTCIFLLADRLARGTGGIAIQTETQGAGATREQVVDIIFDIVVAACEGRPVEPPPPPQVALIAFDRRGELYLIDPATGQDTFRTDTFSSDLETNEIGTVSSTVFVPTTGKLWLGMGGASECGGCILTLTLPNDDAEILTSQPSEFTSGLPGLARRPSDGAIFGPEGDSSDFFSLDPITGQLTVVGDLGFSVSGGAVTFVGGTGYLTSSDTLYTFTATASSVTTSEVGTMSFVGFPSNLRASKSIGSMVTMPDGTVLGLFKDGGGSEASRSFLVRINVANAVVTNIGQNTNLLDGLTILNPALLPPPSDE